MSEDSISRWPWLGYDNHLLKEMEEQGELIFVTPGKQELLAREGFMFLLIEGELVIYVADEEGNERPLMVLGEGALLGEGQLFNQFSCRVTIRATKLTKIRVFSRETVLQLIEAKPELVGEIVRSMSHKMGIILEQIEELAFCSAVERLENILSRLKQKPDHVWPRYENGAGPSHQELAEMVGVHRVTISRLVRDLK